jgi:hypothetical protein
MRAALLLVALLAACGQPDDDAKAVAEKAVTARLKDPDSARFSGLRVVSGEPDAKGYRHVFVCGSVNAKNSFGGYGGDARFVVERFETGDTARIVAVNIEDPLDRTRWPTGDSSFEKFFWNKSCRS